MASASGTKKKASERWALPVSQARSRATRERLLAAAETVFAQKGYDGAKISDIAEEAGCSVGAVYFRFKDKDGNQFEDRMFYAGRKIYQVMTVEASGIDAASHAVGQRFLASMHFIKH